MDLFGVPGLGALCCATRVFFRVDDMALQIDNLCLKVGDLSHEVLDLRGGRHGERMLKRYVMRIGVVDATGKCQECL